MYIAYVANGTERRGVQEWGFSAWVSYTAGPLSAMQLLGPSFQVVNARHTPRPNNTRKKERFLLCSGTPHINLIQPLGDLEGTPLLVNQVPAGPSVGGYF